MAPRRGDVGKKPQRPKRPPTPYMVFMKLYLRSQDIKSPKEAQKAIKAGAKKWNALSRAEKDRYMRSSLKARAVWTQAMEVYKSQVQAMKKPATPFASFVKDYCGGEFGPLNTVGLKAPDLSKQAAALWHKLEPRRRDAYSRRYQREFQDYQLRMKGGTSAWIESARNFEYSASVSQSPRLSLEDREARARSRVAKFRARRGRNDHSSENDKEAPAMNDTNPEGTSAGDGKDCGKTSNETNVGEGPSAVVAPKKETPAKRRSTRLGKRSARSSRTPRRSVRPSKTTRRSANPPKVRKSFKSFNARNKKLAGKKVGRRYK